MRPTPSVLSALIPAALLLLACTAAADWPSISSSNLAVCTAPNSQQGAVVSTDVAGGVIVVWQDQRGADFDLYAQHVRATGVVDPGWPVNGRLVCGAAGNQTNPKAVSDGAGGVVIAWQDARAGTTSDIYAQHLRADGSLDPAWPADGRAVCAAAGSQSSVLAVGDLAGGAVLAWRDNRNDTDLYATHVLANGQLDPAWPVDGLAVAAGPGAQIFAAAAADGGGGVLLAWQDTRGLGAPDVYAQHVLVNGSLAAGWPANGLAVCAAAEAQQFPSIVGDGSGGAIVAWEDFRNTLTFDIYAQHVRPNGTADPAWPANGAAVCVAAGNQTRAKLVADGVGGAFAAWLDARSGVLPTLYAQHVLATGSLDPAWPAAGLGFNLAQANHANLVLLPDGGGGALAVWDDARSGLDVYAHHLLAAGSVDPAWPANGRAVSNATASQSAAGAAIPDGSGGCIAAWSDTRNAPTTGNDIYAQRVQANGQLGGNVVDVPRADRDGLTLAPLTPTPSRGGRLAVRYTLPADGRVSLELLDVAGRLIERRDLGLQGAGGHAADWKVQAHLAAGLHFLRLRFGTETRTVRAISLQ